MHGEHYILLGKKWSAGHTNRMIKVPATPGGLGAIEELVASGVAVNITLIFSERQYLLARDAAFRGVQRRTDKENVKTVYSIFVSRVDVYTETHVPTLIPAAQGLVGIVNAKRIWKMYKDFWADKGLPRKQEMIFASTGTKKMKDGSTPPAWKYVAAFAGSDIETNPPETNEAVAKTNPPHMFTKMVDQMPPADVLADIDKKVDIKKLEETLMSEGLAKFADPHKASHQAHWRELRAGAEVTIEFTRGAGVSPAVLSTSWVAGALTPRPAPSISAWSRIGHTFTHPSPAELNSREPSADTASPCTPPRCHSNTATQLRDPVGGEHIHRSPASSRHTPTRLAAGSTASRGDAALAACGLPAVNRPASPGGEVEHGGPRREFAPVGHDRFRVATEHAPCRCE